MEDAIADGHISDRSAKIMRRNITLSSIPLNKDSKRGSNGNLAGSALSQALATLEADDKDPNAEADPLAA